MSQTQLQIELTSRVPMGYKSATKILLRLKAQVASWVSEETYPYYSISIFPSGDIYNIHFHETKNFIIDKKEGILSIETKTGQTVFISLGAITNIEWHTQ